MNDNDSSIKKEPYCHGLLSQDDADDRLIEHGAVDGSYLIRKSRDRDSGEQSWIVSAVHGGRVQHYDVSVQSRGGRALYSLGGGVKSGSLQQLIEIYSDPHMGPPAPLIEMVERSPAHQDGMASMAGPSAESSVSEVNISSSNPFLTPSTPAKNVTSPSKASRGNPFLDITNAETEEVELSPFNPFTAAVSASVDIPEQTTPALNPWPTSGTEHDSRRSDWGEHGDAHTATHDAIGPETGTLMPQDSGSVTSPEHRTDTDAFWSCSVCTYDNHPLIAHCEMCEAARSATAAEPAMSGPLPIEASHVSQQTAVVPLPRAEAAPNNVVDRRQAPSTIQTTPPAHVGTDRQQADKTPEIVGNHRANPGASTEATGRQRSNPFLVSQDHQPKPLARQVVGGSTRNGSTGSWHRTVPGGSSGTERLFCEGPLIHVTMGKKPRWVVLTSKKLMMYVQNASELLATVRREHITVVRAVGDKRVHVAVVEPSGHGTTELVLECSKRAVRTKWMDALETSTHDLSRLSSEELIVEGPLLKLQPFGAMNRTRWVRVTTKSFAYFVAEAGDLLASVEYNNITGVFLEGKRRFTVRASVPFTRTGLYEVNAQCPNERVRQKWITGLARVLPVSMFKGGDYTR
eukprot:m.1258192 g.1258192  ORF g.1258192 m.1258192 type:complete len:630 (-) comp24717_c0_seq5:2077-3966(-)